MLPADGGPGYGTIRITAEAVSPLSLAGTPISVPFQFDTKMIPPDLTLDALSGNTPAVINVTGLLDSLLPARATVEQLSVTVGDQSQRITVILSRPGPPILVSPPFLPLSGPAAQGSATARVQVNPPDDATSFQVLSIPPGIIVSPLAGNGSATLTVVADLTRFPVGTTATPFSVQVGSTEVSINASVRLDQYPLSFGQGPRNLAPGLRLQLNAYGVAANLPSTGAWADVSRRPQIGMGTRSYTALSRLPSCWPIPRCGSSMCSSRTIWI